MKLRLQNYAVIILTGNSYTKFNNNKIIVYKYMTYDVHKITEFYTSSLAFVPT
jgi:hypothetical protein